ncbi:MAG: hypothetical protein KDD22_07990, partial [Bdellovibrionales bacterium]|nr:hypothetical protein [Bdellovibrionales bacterium]
LIWTGDRQLLSLTLKVSGELEVRVFKNRARILKGRLIPLPPVTFLEYGPQLDLTPLRRMVLAGPMMSSYLFEVTDTGLRGLTTRGHTFQKLDTLNAPQLSSCPDLFFALKRIEKYYIRPESDPFYQELVSLLEKSYQLISAGEPNCEKLAETALMKGRLALKNIFPNDKLLLLLVTNIEYWLIQRNRAVAPETPPPLT